MKRKILIFAGVALAGLAQFLSMTPSQAQGPYPIYYRYPTNAITAQTVLWEKAYFTNMSGNWTISIGAPALGSFQTIVLFLTNSSSTDYKITFPNGVWGTPGSGTPPVYYATNKMVTRINIEHYGQLMTNAYKLDFAP